MRRGDSGFDRLGQRGGDYADRQAGNLADNPRRTLIRWGLALLALVAVLWVGGCALGFIGDWGNEAKRTVGVKNSREQTTAVLDDWTSMEAAAGNACQAASSKGSTNDPLIIEKPEFAYAAKYRDIKRDYDRRMGNFFEARNVRNVPIPGALHGYPQRAPSLKQMQDRVGGC